MSTLPIASYKYKHKNALAITRFITLSITASQVRGLFTARWETDLPWKYDVSLIRIKIGNLAYLRRFATISDTRHGRLVMGDRELLIQGLDVRMSSRKVDSITLLGSSFPAGIF